MDGGWCFYIGTVFLEDLPPAGIHYNSKFNAGTLRTGFLHQTSNLEGKCTPLCVIPTFLEEILQI